MKGSAYAQGTKKDTGFLLAQTLGRSVWARHIVGKDSDSFGISESKTTRNPKKSRASSSAWSNAELFLLHVRTNAPHPASNPQNEMSAA